MAQKSNHPLVVDIKRHSLEDGPGIRSVVFFKGCPLRCVFCHNPETQEAGQEIAFFPRDCIECKSCGDACPEGAIDMGLAGRIHRERCRQCGSCADVCPGGGLRVVGTYYPVENLLEILLRDLPFYRHSGGGVTLSGGECTMYPNYLEPLLKSLKERDVHVVLETAGYFNYESFKQNILPYVDIIYYDIKLADPELHKAYTGKDNKAIHANLKSLLKEEGLEVHPRIPLIPGITTSRENLTAIVDLLCNAGADDVSFLPYNPLGLEMAVKIGRQSPPLPDLFMKPDEENEIFDMLKHIIEERPGKYSSNVEQIRST